MRLTNSDSHQPRATDITQVDWSTIDVVVFDVDGTLYDATRLRLAMLGQLIQNAWQTRSFDTLRTLRTFRRVREALGDVPDADFLQLQFEQTADRHGLASEAVKSLTAEWMEVRPLPLLRACRFPHVAAVFDGLRAQGKTIAVLSDYPAVAKLAAMGLSAELVVSAVDPEVRRLKPDPRGLRSILARTGVPAERTLMVGDRFDRDGEVALRAGVRALIRSARPHASFATFKGYNDPLFQPLFSRA
jgi:phosphoglycolate phosphatase